MIALVSVRKADEPPDREHPYGHEKAENLAAAIEGMLILVGAGIIVFEATRRLVVGAEVEHLGVGIAVIGCLGGRQPGVSAYLGRRARELRSAALEGDAAHLRADALTSVGVLVGLGLVAITGSDAFDPIAALVVAVAIVVAGLRILTALLARAAGRGAAARGARPDRGRDRPRPARRRWSATTSSAPAARAPGATSTSTSSSAPGPRSRTPTRWPTASATRSRPRSPTPTC